MKIAIDGEVRDATPEEEAAIIAQRAEDAKADDPSNDPNDYPLNKFQFETMVLALKLSIPAIEASIDVLPLSDFDKGMAKSRLRNATTYNRSHPLVEQLRAKLKMTVADLDAAWMTAKDLR